MFGEGMVSLGTAVVTVFFRNEKASAKIVSCSVTRSWTSSAADWKSSSPCSLRKWTCSSSCVGRMPPSW